MKYLLLLLPFIAKVYSFNQNIIVLPKKKGVFAHIKTKDSFINFYSKHVLLLEYHFGKLYEDKYIFEGGINLTNFDLYDNCPISLIYIDKKNNIFELTSRILDDKFMNAASSILYILGYIDNKFYLEDKEKNYLYFGGIPQKINDNYNFFSLKENGYINLKMEVKFDNGTIYGTNVEKTQISFSSCDKYIICFTRPIFNLIKKTVLKEYDDEYCNRTFIVYDDYNEEIRSHYRPLPDDKLNTDNFKKEMKNLFPNFTITIGNKILNLNKYNIFKDHDEIYTDLLISSSPCDTIKFGKYFFELFDYSEYDKYTKNAKIYLKKNNIVFKEIEENFDDIKYIKTSKFDILILFFIIFIVTIFDIIIINKSKKIKYFNNYYEIYNY